MAAFKPWEDHSDRWKRSQLRKGLTPKRWDAWLRLSQKSRRDTDPYKYASGDSVRDQRRQALIDAAMANYKKQIAPKETKRIARNLRRMSNDQLRWTAKATSASLLKRVKMKPEPGRENLWWY